MKTRFQHREENFEISIARKGDIFRSEINGIQQEFEILDSLPGQITIRVDGQPAIVHYAASRAGLWLSLHGCTYLLEKPAIHKRASIEENSKGFQVHAPMPAQVRSLQVAVGEQVEKGQVLMLLEAMKMEIRIKAPTAGKIFSLPVRPDQTVAKDQLLAAIEAVP